MGYFDNLYGNSGKTTKTPQVKQQQGYFGNLYTQPTTAPKVTAQPKPKPIQPLVKKQTAQEKVGSFLTGAARTMQAVAKDVRSLDFDRLKKTLQHSKEGLPGTVKIAGGVIAESWAKQQKMVDEFFKKTNLTNALPQQFKAVGALNQALEPAKQQVYKKAEQKGAALRETGQKEVQKAYGKQQKMGAPKNKTQAIAEALTFNLPQMAVSTGLTIGTAFVTRNPSAATVVGLSTSYGLGASEVYTEARNNGLTDKQALPFSMAGGAIIGAIDFAPLGRLVRKTTALEPVKQQIVKQIAKNVVSTGKQAGFEGITEGMQEIVGNAVRSVYSGNKDVFENVGMATVVGALFGGMADVSVSGAVWGAGKLSPKEGIEKTNQQIENAFNTSPDNRTPEQQLLVQSVLGRQLSPDEAVSIVVENDLTKTPEGKQIMKAVIEARQEGKEIKIVMNEDRDITSIQVVDEEPLQTPEEKLQTYLREPASDIQQKNQEYLINNLEKAKKDYEARLQKEYGTADIVSADDAKYILPGFEAKLSSEYHTASSSFSKYMYDELLVKNRGMRDNSVLFLSGGTGAGKTTAIRDAEVDIKDASIVYDTNLTGKESASSKIDKALENGYKVAIVYVQRDPVAAFEHGVIPRVRSQGRIVNINEHIKRHLDAFKTLEFLKQKYGDKIDVAYIDNTKGRGEARIVPFDKLPKYQYTEQELRKILLKKVDEAVKQYETDKTKGLTTEEAAAIIGAEVRQSDDKESQQEPQKEPRTQQVEEKETRTKPEESPKDDIREERYFDKEGKEITGKKVSVFNTKEAKTIQEVVSDQISAASTGAESEAELIDSVTKIIDNAISKANGERYALSGIRTAINKELFGAAGVSLTGDYRANYAELKAVMREGVGIDEYLAMLESKRIDVDDLLIAAEPKQAVKPEVKISKAIAGEKKKAPLVKRETTPSKEEPVGTGKFKNSRLFERVKETLGEEYEAENRKYQVLDLEKQATAVVEMIENEPERAVRIAKGREEPPLGMTQNAMAIGLAELAISQKDYKTAAEMYTKASLRSTRLGQEIVSLRGEMGNDTPFHAIREVMRVRVDRVAKQYDRALKALSLPEKTPKMKQIDKYIEGQVAEVKKDITRRMKQIQSAQSIIDALKCK